MINSYKEMTQYSIESELKDIKVVPLGARIIRFVNPEFWINLTKDSLYGQYLGSPAEEILKWIRFLGSSSYMTNVVATLLSYTINYY